MPDEIKVPNEAELAGRKRRYQLLVVKTIYQAHACRKLILEHDTQATVNPPKRTKTTPGGFPFRDDYGMPTIRYTCDMNTRLEYLELIKLCYEAAGNWIEIF